MERRPRRKSDAARRANQIIRSRTLLLMVSLGVVTFVMLFWKLYDLQIVQHEQLQEQAVAQQTRSAVITASRGTIYDKNGSVMAISSSAETVCISPKEIAEYVAEQEASGDPSAAARDEDYIARGLARILGLEAEDIRARMERVFSQYEILKSKVEQAEADEVRRFINGEIDDEGNALTTVDADGKTVLLSDPSKSPTRLRGIFLQPDSKRIYPYGTLASNVIGFVNADNVGAYGLEAKYDDLLEGTSGLTVTAQDANSTPLLFQYEQYRDAEDGQDLVLTLDTEVQSSLEKGIESMVAKFDAKNGAAGIVMDVDTGGILAMASYPNYDPNAYSTVTDEKLLATLSGLEEGSDAYQEALAAAQYRQWRNKCYQDTYEPGSTFKPITLAIGLETGIVDMDDTFDCSGSIRVEGWGKPINCSRHSGHGHQTLKEAVGNSCNPAFVTMGLRIGTQTYYPYLRSFGLMDTTGVDLPAEAGSIFAGEEDFNSNVVSLASYSFGQTFNVTPLQLIRAQAACINGGYLYTPYLVDQVLDDDGNIVYQHEATPIRQVISEETSATVRECLEWVVSGGTGRNGQVAGYRIGGKTGTADKTGNPDREVVVSFMCFAPADDPEIIMLLTLDTPSRNTGVYVSGGNMVAPTASQIMSEILPILGIEPDYTAEELVGADTTVPNVVGLDAETAKTKLTNAGFSCKTVGDGATVTDQTPAGGAIVPNNATVILYLGAEKPDESCTVPDVVGLTASEANKAMTNAGLIMKVAGATTSSSGNVRALSQSEAAGTEMEAGSVVTVQFGDDSVLD